MFARLLLPVLLTVCCFGRAGAACSVTVPAQDDGDDTDGELLPGLVATFSRGGGQALRIDRDVQFNWQDASPDLRVPAERFQVTWRGKLLVPASGEYRFHVLVAGTAQLSVGERPVLHGSSEEARWFSSDHVEQELGHHAIEVRFTKTAPQARIGLYWESRAFGLEPVAARWLFHEKRPAGEPDEFERGQELVQAYRCAACHQIPDVELDGRAPSLEKLAGRINSAWLVPWLENPHAWHDQSRMPAFGFSADDARAVAAFLLRSSSKHDAPAKPHAERGDPKAGESLVRSLGCLACHTLGEHGSDAGAARFGGGPLDRVAEKRPAGFFREWLTKPQASNPAHRMPIFALSKNEVDDVASFLVTCHGEPEPDGDADTAQFGDDEINRGRQLVNGHRCAACHDIPGVSKPDLVGDPLHGGHTRQRPIVWRGSCLSQIEPPKRGAEPAASARPQFRLDENDQRAIVAFIEQLPARPAPQSRFELGRRLLRELNCTACHPRELERGLQPSELAPASGRGSRIGPRLGEPHADSGPRPGLIAKPLVADPAALRGELEPPSLTSVGDKLHDETLAQLIDGGLPPRRPWLKVRMPRFAHREAERDAIVHFLVEHDRIPEGAIGIRESGIAETKPKDVPPLRFPTPDSRFPSLDPAAALAAGHQLVSARGFGCMSCHTIGKHQPKGIAANARGSDLLKIGERVRHPWFLRWVRDPARIVPGMEMPSITVPIAGVLDGRVQTQIEALWRALDSPSFVVPSDRDTAQQIIALKPGDAPVILRDVMFDCPPGGGWCPRAFAIGLPNRHNVLFDLDAMSLRAWWYGDFARQRTEGKTWLWEPAGLPVWTKASNTPPIALRRRDTGEILLPVKQGQTVGWLEEWGRLPPDAGAVWLRYRLRFADGVWAHVSELIMADQGDDYAGFTRVLTIKQLDRPGQFEPLVVYEPDAAASLAHGQLTFDGALGRTVVRGQGKTRWTHTPITIKPDQKLYWLEPGQSPKRNESSHQALLSYIVRIATAESSGALSKPLPVVESQRLVGAPGCELLRLPLQRFVMPTAIAFRPDGTPLVCSLNGGVYLALDSDRDGLEDTWQQFGDRLAAPFGVLVDADAVIVSHKPELVRLEDRDGNGQADFTKVIATGWGYNEDYHDWTVGFARDAKGRFYVTTGSDYGQKGRPREALLLRGHALRISPDGNIEDLARGIRFSNGIAMNRDGEVFFTDNQGVQNTFNEINHLVPGSRYGVPALDDPPAAEDPWPERPPAIAIPHPWTRSVNGICFLESGGKWGPFEGHGIGCEYDTRGLIRFSLQKVGDTYQGACYPFTLPEDQVPPDQRLLGPICCAVSPNGDLYVGGLRDSGWGGGNNVGELVRIRPAGQVPLGIRQVRAFRDGFVIDFTGPVDPAAAAQAANYTISSYRRIWKGTYATPDSDRRTEKIIKAEVSADCRSVVLTLAGMRAGFVYDMHLASIGPDGASLWPAEAYYTLNSIPDLPPR